MLFNRSARREMTGPVISRMAVPAASTSPICEGPKTALVKKRRQRGTRPQRPRTPRRREPKSDRTKKRHGRFRESDAPRHLFESVADSPPPKCGLPSDCGSEVVM